MKATRSRKPSTSKRVSAGNVTKDERTKQIGPDRAAEIFKARTRIDPRTDSLVVSAAGVAVSAELIEQVRHLNEWLLRIRKAVKGTPPAQPDWIERALRAATPAHATSSGKAVITFGKATGIAPAKQVDLEPLAQQVASFRNQVLEAVALGTKLGGDLSQTWAELTTLQPIGQGRQGAFRAPRKRGPQRDEARWRFLWWLQRTWMGAGRAEILPTDVSLLAVYVGLDDGRGGLDAVIRRWSEMIQKSKRGTAP